MMLLLGHHDYQFKYIVADIWPAIGVCWRRDAHKLFLKKDPSEEGSGKATLMDKVILDNRGKGMVESRVVNVSKSFFGFPFSFLYSRFLG